MVKPVEGGPRKVGAGGSAAPDGSILFSPSMPDAEPEVNTHGLGQHMYDHQSARTQDAPGVQLEVEKERCTFTGNHYSAGVVVPAHFASSSSHCKS